MSKESTHNTALILGATSGVGRALAQELALKKQNLWLVARGLRDLAAIKNDLEIRFQVEVKITALDLADEKINFDVMFQEGRNLDSIFVCLGAVSDFDDGLLPNHAKMLLETNYGGPQRVLSYCLSRYESLKLTRIAICSSIAVMAPRGSNVFYGAAKAALEYFAKAMQHKFSSSPLKISIFRLGYVDSELSFGKPLKLPITPPRQVATILLGELKKSSPRRMVYIPGWWGFVVYMLSHLPWMIYKRLKF